MSKPKYDSTVARVAGNVLSGMVGSAVFISEGDPDNLVKAAVILARAIVAEVQRTEPVATPEYCGNAGYAKSGTKAFCSYSLGHGGDCNLGLAVKP
jgi:hypothetical protein